MSNRINIYFDYGGSYIKTEEEDKWISGGRTYSLAFKTSVEEVSYLMLRERIYRKVGVDESSVRLKLSYIPMLMKPPRTLYIVDDEDVDVYLTSSDLQHCRSYLNVEVMNNIDIGQRDEHWSRVGHGSSSSVKLCELHSNDDVFNEGAMTLYVENAREEEEEEEHETREDDVNEGNEEEIHEEQAGVENNTSYEHVELPRNSQGNQFVEEWEDGMSLEKGQEFVNKATVRDLVDRAAFKNCFGFSVMHSDTVRLVLKCRQVGCNWYLRVAKVTNSECWSVRTYRKMHTCSRSTSTTNNSRRNGTPRLVASILHEDYPGKYATPSPKILMDLVQRRLGVKVSYSTALRGKKLAIRDVRGNPEECFQMLYSYLYMLKKMNHGTTTRLEVDETNKFKYLFVALGASIEGFQAMI